MIVTPLEFNAFSLAGFDPAARRSLRAKLIIKSTKTRTATLLRRNGDELASRSSGLADVLSAWCQGEAKVEEAMRLPLSLPALRDSEERDAVWIAALSAAHLHSQGWDGQWRATFAQPSPLAFGFHVTPPTREVSVFARAGEVKIQLDGGPAIAVDSLASTAPTFALGDSRVPILGQETQATFPVDKDDGFADVPAEVVGGTLAEAVAILRTYSPSYFDWVAEALAAVTPIQPHEGKFTQSFSDPGVNGVVFLSFPTPALKIAELLVHETCHQYFHFGQLNTLFSNGMDKALYWSPYVMMDRPIDRILISFHAFANCIIFYRQCLSAGMKEGRDLAESWIVENLAHLGPMEDHLQRSPGLTAAGRAIFEPLREELHR